MQCSRNWRDNALQAAINAGKFYLPKQLYTTLIQTKGKKENSKHLHFLC